MEKLKAIAIGLYGNHIKDLLELVPGDVDPGIVRSYLRGLANFAAEISEEGLDGKDTEEKAQEFKALCGIAIREAAEMHSHICEDATQRDEATIQRELSFISLASFVLEAILAQLEAIEGKGAGEDA